MKKAWLEVSRRGKTWRVFLKVAEVSEGEAPLSSVQSIQLETFTGEGADLVAIAYANDIKKGVMAEAISMEG